VFSMALPLPDQGEAEPRSSSVGFLLDYYGGQILFRPTNADSFLYLVTGPAQSDGQLQAKILRFRVGGMPSGMYVRFTCLFFHFSSSHHKYKSRTFKSEHNLRQESVPWRSKYTHRS